MIFGEPRFAWQGVTALCSAVICPQRQRLVVGDINFARRFCNKASTFIVSYNALPAAIARSAGECRDRCPNASRAGGKKNRFRGAEVKSRSGRAARKVGVCFGGRRLRFRDLGQQRASLGSRGTYRVRHSVFTRDSGASGVGGVSGADSERWTENGEQGPREQRTGNANSAFRMGHPISCAR